MPSLKNKFFLAFSLIAIQVAVSILGAVFVTASPATTKIIDGVKVADVSLGGSTKAEAKIKLTRALEPGLSEEKINIIYGNKQWMKSYSDLGIHPDYAATVEAAYGVGREKNPVVRKFNFFKLRRQGLEIPLRYVLEGDKAKAFFTLLEKEVSRRPVNATIKLENNKFVILPEAKGVRVLVEPSIDKLIAAVNNGEKQTRLVVEELMPEITSGDLNSIREDLAVSVTSVDDVNSNRVHNIKRAADQINNTLLKPGQVFSFNQIVGARTREKGFREAPVIANNRLLEGLGGGVCQVSTTLYQAVRLAGLEVIERHAHSLPPDYVPLGQDATVADGQLDLRFKNTGDSPVLIIAEVQGKELIVRIMGKEETNIKKRLISEVQEEIQPEVVVRKDNGLARGASEVVTEGQKGYRVKVYREITEKNGEKVRELISEDLYKPQDKIIRIGTKTSRPGKTK